MKNFATPLSRTILLILVIISLSYNESVSQAKKRGFEVIRQDITITMTDGTVIDATKFYPDDVPPKAGWPALIFCHGYGLSKENELQAAEERAGYGYYTLAYSMRGQGNSTGQSNLISMVEANDFKEVVAFVRSESIVNDERVGATGASQGGTIPYMAVCTGLNLRCIVSQVANPEMSETWIENNSVKMTLLWSLSYPSSLVRYNTMTQNFRRWILADTPEKWDSLKTFFPIGRNFLSQVRNNQTPILASTVWQDRFFSTYGHIKALDSNTSVVSKYYFGTYDAHGADMDETELEFHDEYFNDWVDYWLDDFQNGVLERPKYTYASSKYPRVMFDTVWLWTWDRFTTETWPPAGVVPQQFFLSAGNKLRTITNTALPDTISLLNDVKDSTLTMEESVNREFRGVEFEQKFGKNNLVFDTPPLSQNSRMVGTPKVNLHYKTDATIAQFNVQVWEVRPNNTEELVTRVNYTDRNVVPNVIKQITFSSMSHSHIFRAGNRIRIKITNIDNVGDASNIFADWFLRTNPHVLPVLKKGKHTIYMNEFNPSYVELPLMDYIPNSITLNSQNTPSDFNLNQNYPNPFNPATTIGFDVPADYKGIVTLKIYDVIGREVSVLVNDRLKPGNYNVNFDATLLASGLYFYELKAGDYQEMKKMMLVK